MVALLPVRFILVMAIVMVMSIIIAFTNIRVRMIIVAFMTDVIVVVRVIGALFTVQVICSVG